MNPIKPVERRDELSADEFFNVYVKQGIPVVVSGALKHCPASQRWNLDYLREQSGDKRVRLKEGYLSNLNISHRSLSSYLDNIEHYEAGLLDGTRSVEDMPGYLHDIPLVSILGEAVADLVNFPVEFFPKWYQKDWWQFSQFFLGPSHSLTPLHFDTLLTHNLFFQVTGKKRFILLSADQGDYCYRYQWRWFSADPEQPDYVRHPLYQQAQPVECIVEPGDMLYFPPGTLHHVRSLSCAISFNVDWHTPSSACKGVAAISHGMPLKNVYYNAVMALGIGLGIPVKQILPWYRSYLNYMS